MKRGGWLHDGSRYLVFNLTLVVLAYALLFAPDRAIDHLPEITRSDCLRHRPWLVWTYALSDLAVGLALLGVTVTYVRVAYSRAAVMQVPKSITRWVLSWQATFAALLALHHFVDTAIIWVPLYELLGYVKVALAAVSMYSALWVVRRVKAVVMIPRGLLADALQEMQTIINKPATSAEEYRQVLKRAMGVLDSVVGPHAD